MKTNFKVIAFDADDTLWVNETFFRQTEAEFCDLLSDFCPHDNTMEVLYTTEMENLAEYGYGIKGFMLSMIETALKVTDNNVSKTTLNNIIELGKNQINQPVELLNGMEDTLEYLKEKGCKLIVATKGDLLDQERKLKKSKLEKYFHHVEVMSNKTATDYQKLLSHLEIAPEDFLMIGNSYKSDIEPLLELGSYGIHIPFHITWVHEKAIEKEEHPNWIKLKSVSELKTIF